MIAAISLLVKDLIGAGLTELADAIFDKGEDFVKDKVKEATGIELKDRVTKDELKTLKNKYEDILPLLQEKNRHVEKVLAFKEHIEGEKTNRRKLSTEKYIKTDHKVADEIARKIIRENMIYIVICILIELASIVYLQNNGNLLAIITGIFGSVITNLYQERQSVINFHFGSSLGSKMKDNAIINKGK